DFAHVLAISTWAGGLIALVWCVLLPARDDREVDARALGATVWRFSLTALVSVALLATTGMLQAFNRLVLINDLYETPYGIALVHPALAPVTRAEKVAFRFTLVEHDMGEQELVATERAPGEYVADGSTTAMFGTWKIQTIVRLAGREDVSTVFTFPVAAPAG